MRLGFTLDETFNRFTGFTTASFIPICLSFDDRSCSRILATFRLYQKLNTAPGAASILHVIRVRAFGVGRVISANKR